ncbi:MAG: hypothetical protein ACD_71C00191G0001 [uncultured bacterium (gcode 4)]|uniref:KTSC domain-containing protein n=1 Tax=uncultured bacterium (gcode 4) TaxID=1234023 RepID=K1YMS4_9BACT|nr:MAG: hypothetical protein ACD_71C00191G0001 [uncultured bacterium (gcode 4)]
MKPYKNLGWDSGVTGYESGTDYIIVQFASGKDTLYTYTHAHTGILHVENMKKFADAGMGLNSYISTNKPLYSFKK